MSKNLFGCELIGNISGITTLQLDISTSIQTSLISGSFLSYKVTLDMLSASKLIIPYFLFLVDDAHDQEWDLMLEELMLMETWQILLKLRFSSQAIRCQGLSWSFEEVFLSHGGNKTSLLTKTSKLKNKNQRMKITFENIFETFCFSTIKSVLSICFRAKLKVKNLL